MGSKKERKIQRIEAAKELARLSGQVADGYLEMEGKRAELPEDFIFKKALKIKKNELSFELSIKVKRTKEEGAREKQSKGAFGKVSDKSSKRPYKAKKLKKEIGMLWKALKRCVRSGEPFRDKQGFLNRLESYGKGAEKEWASEWERCVSVVKEVFELAEKGQKEEALEMCRQVDELTKACHKKFK